MNLQPAIQAAIDGEITKSAGGFLIIATAANGQNVQFALNQLGWLKTENILDFISGLEDLYDLAVEELTPADASDFPAPSDEQILPQMLTHLAGATECENDFSLMRVVERQASFQ